MPDYAELDINLTPSVDNYYLMELSYNDPDDQGKHPSIRGSVLFDLEELRNRQNQPEVYGGLLCDYLFTDAEMRAYFNEVRSVAEKSRKILRVRLTINREGNESEKAEVSALHGLRWETLRDPRDGSWLLTKEDLLFSRFLSSQDWKPVLARTGTNLRALVVIAAPKELREGKFSVNKQALEPIDINTERARAAKSLGNRVSLDFLTSEEGSPGQVTLENLVMRLKGEEGYDIIYLVCHGSMLHTPPEPYLLLEDQNGERALTPARYLVDVLRDLRSDKKPRLVVLLSCQSGGKGSDIYGALSALGPQLAETGIPAVIAMQGDISMITADTFIVRFFEELAVDGLIDRALASARGAVRNRPDSWMPALFMRLKSGRLWEGERDHGNRPFMAPQAIGYIVGREDSLSKLKQRLLNSPGNTVTVLMQFPGIGKTELAVLLANDDDIQRHYKDGVLWASLGKKPDLSALLSDWAAELGISNEELNQTATGDRFKIIKRYIGQKRMLVIVDDAWRKEHVAPFREILHRCDLVVTTRSVEVAAELVSGEVTEENGVFRLKELDAEEGLALLSALAPKAMKRASDVKVGRELVREVGALPLALVLMGRYLVSESLSGQPRRISEALNRLKDARKRLGLKISHLPGRPEDMPNSLLAAIEMSIEELNETTRQALEMLCAFRPKPYLFSTEDAAGAFEIEYDNLSSLVDSGLLEYVSDPEVPKADLSNLVETSIESETNEEAVPEYYRLPRTVAEYVLTQLGEAQLQEYHQQAVLYFAGLLRSYEEDRSGDASPYERAYSYENPSWQKIKAAWLYHQAQTIDRTAANLNLIQIYIDVFWWWRCYNKEFPFCDQLLGEWRETQTSEVDRKWLELITQFQQAYPTGYEKQGKGDWHVVESALLEIRRLGKLDGPLDALENDPQRMHVRAITNFFLAESYRFRAINDSRSDLLIHEVIAILEKKLYEDDDDWNLPWVYWHLADLMLERGEFEKALDFVARSLELVRKSSEDLFDENRDNEVISNDYRVRADAAWQKGLVKQAFQDYALAVFFAYLFQCLPKSADFYTVDFYVEMVERTCKRLSELWAGGANDTALQACRDLRLFWQPYWDKEKASIATVDFQSQLDGEDLLDLERLIFPRRPVQSDMKEDSDYVSQVLIVTRDMKENVEKML